MGRKHEQETGGPGSISKNDIYVVPQTILLSPKSLLPKYKSEYTNSKQTEPNKPKPKPKSKKHVFFFLNTKKTSSKKGNRWRSGPSCRNFGKFTLAPKWIRIIAPATCQLQLGRWFFAGRGFSWGCFDVSGEAKKQDVIFIYLKEVLINKATVCRRVDVSLECCKVEGF